MIRHSILPHACITLALGLVAVVAFAPAGWGQDRATQDRLDRLERDLNMLQRQVYRGGPPPMSGDGGMAVGAEVRMDRVEAQMRDLTGRVEEFANQIAQLRQRLEQINSDIDVRFSQVSASAAPLPGAPRAAPGAPPPAASRQPRPDPMAAGGGTLTPPGSMAPGTVVPAPGGPAAGGAPAAGPSSAGPSPIFGTLTPPGTPSNVPELASAGSARPPGAGGLPGGSPSHQFNYAFGLLKQADYPGAEQALRAFVQQHPDDPLAGNAEYWIGETLYARGKYSEAAAAFAEGYKRYPKSPKAADDLLKLSMALARTNQKQNACLALTQLEREFPSPGATVKERAAAERRRLGC